MVSVSHSLPVTEQAALPDASSWIESLSASFGADDLAMIRRALDFALPAYGEATLASGEPVLTHALGTATIVAALRMDAESVAAAVLQSIPDCLPDHAARLAALFGPAVAQLVEGVARVGHVQALSGVGAQGQRQDAAVQAEAVRKMLIAMSQDLRAVVVKLADYTQTMRAVARADDAIRVPIARATQEIYAPLANRLGIWQLKWELEDLAFRYTEPELYRRIARLLDEKRIDREQFIARVIEQLQGELARAGIAGAEVSGRPKHIYSIYRKMRRKRLEFGEVYDVRAVRVLVADIKDCYTALGVVHSLWQPIPGEFDDYIARPKGNNYQSLHTAVVAFDGRALEVQIRTFDMHRHAELGVAAHWRYKEGGSGDSGYEQKIAWVRQVLAWRDELGETDDFVEQFKTDLFQDTVYAMTPQGRVVALPQGSTPVDFAYHVHSELGHRCRGARVDGAMVPLNFRLRNGQLVEIITAKEGGPSRDWLDPQQGYLHSPRARAKVRQWFKSQELSATLAQGRTVVEREIRRQGLSDLNLDKLAHRLGFARTEEMFAAAGRGDLGHRALQQALRDEAPAPEAEEPLHLGRRTATGSGGILLSGVDKLLTTMARCCRPLPPDPIVGFVTRGRGVTVHRSECPDLRRLSADAPERLIAADWGESRQGRFEAGVMVRAHDRTGLLKDVSEVFSKQRLNVTGVNTLSKGHVALMQFTVEVSDAGQLEEALRMLRGVTGVYEARRR